MEELRQVETPPEVGKDYVVSHPKWRHGYPTAVRVVEVDRQFVKVVVPHLPRPDKNDKDKIIEGGHYRRFRWTIYLYHMPAQTMRRAA